MWPRVFTLQPIDCPHGNKLICSADGDCLPTSFTWPQKVEGERASTQEGAGESNAKIEGPLHPDAVRTHLTNVTLTRVHDSRFL